MSIIIIGDAFTFPEGTAATNRVHTYAKGFIENGINVHVICFDSRYNTPGDGFTDGINYYHPFGQEKRNKYFLTRSWRKIIKYYKTFFLLRKINKSDKILAAICYTKLIQTQLFAYLLVKHISSKLILERSEHPLQSYQSSALTRFQGRIKTFLEIRLCNGIFCISKYLADFYKVNGIKSNKLLLVPSTVDTNRFKFPSKAILPFKYILYCGSLTILKDGVDILIQSFSLISKRYPEINLVLIGKGDSAEEELAIRNLVVSLNIENKILFTGLLPRSEIPAYLKHAKILALARPKSIIAAAGFPSKLTEYLATGIPVVVTEVGDIPVYLKDQENAFLSKPDNIEAFAAKLDFVLGNYTFAKDIGQKGKELAESTFNYRFQAKRIIGFIKSL